MAEHSMSSKDPPFEVVLTRSNKTGTAEAKPQKQTVHSEQISLKLNPIPSNDSNDPLNWPMWLKILVLTQASLLAAIGGLNTATINPALVQVAHDFDISTVRASYQTTVCIALNGVAPWLWIPIVHKYGRRPVWLATTLLAFGSILGCAYARTYSQLLVARVFNGLFPVGFALGATTATDLFFYHQRGRAIGWFTVTVANGSHVAPIIGGLLGQYCGWRWIFKFLAIVDGLLFILALACLPETRYNRVTESQSSSESTISSLPGSATSATNNHTDLKSHQPPPFTTKTYFNRLRLISLNPSYKMLPTDFILPTLRMVRYPSVLFPAIYYSAMYGFASILPAVTVAAIFTKFFHWDTLRIGLTYGVSLTLGGVLGEAVSGWVCDVLVQRAARHGHTINPELRLRPIWAGNFITVTGLLLYGFTLQYRTSWFLPIFGMGLACFGLQIISTTTYTYSIDAHRSQSSEVAQLFNFVRQMFGMTYAFYVVNMGERIGYQWTFLFFAVCGGVLAFLPIVGLMLYGRVWRAWAEKKFGKVA